MLDESRALASGEQGWPGELSHGKVSVQWVNPELSLCCFQESVQGFSLGLVSLQLILTFGGQCGADQVPGGCGGQRGSYQVRADLCSQRSS